MFLIRPIPRLSVHVSSRSFTTAYSTRRPADVGKYAHHLRLNHPLHDYNALLDAVGSAEVVLIGEASHGTREFYRERALITQRLITEKGFTAVCAEADFPDAHTVNSFIQDTANPPIRSAVDSLKDFKRFPLWMWRNEVMVKYIDWCHRYNKRLSAEGKGLYEQVSFHGMDLYSLYSSIEAVIAYLTKVDSKAADAARRRYGCFERFGNDTMEYAFSTRYGVPTCETQVVEVLRDLHRERSNYLQKKFENFRGPQEEPHWIAQMNAKVAKDAEKYYRTMLLEDVRSWNLRDEHMVHCLEEIKAYLSKGKGSPAKIVVWAHNSHLGDATETDMGIQRGELNVGQLCRQRFGVENTFNIGFSTYNGSVTAAHEWDTPAVFMTVNDARADSFEGFFHSAIPDVHNYMLIFRKVRDVSEAGSSSIQKRSKEEVDQELTRKLAVPRLERAIGVIYKPMTERWSHYFSAKISKQFDAIIHIDRSTAIRPLDYSAHFKDEEENVPEMFPFGV